MELSSVQADPFIYGLQCNFIPVKCEARLSNSKSGTAAGGRERKVKA